MTPLTFQRTTIHFAALTIAQEGDSIGVMFKHRGRNCSACGPPVYSADVSLGYARLAQMIVQGRGLPDCVSSLARQLSLLTAIDYIKLLHPSKGSEESELKPIA
jgi:hypothetical protein